MILETILTAERAASISAKKQEYTIVFSLDVFRASTSIVRAFANGLHSAYTFVDFEEILNLKQISSFDSAKTDFERFFYENSDKIKFGGERAGIKVQGFHFGNSPLEYTKENIAEKILFFSSTNGTKAFKSFPESQNRFIVAFGNTKANIDLAVDLTKKQKIEKIVIVCAGNEGKVSEEDTYFAGYLATELMKKIDLEPDYNTGIARFTFKNYNSIEQEFLFESAHGSKLISIGFEKDLTFALEKNYTDLILKITDNKISVYET